MALQMGGVRYTSGWASTVDRKQTKGRLSSWIYMRRRMESAEVVAWELAYDVD